MKLSSLRIVVFSAFAALFFMVTPTTANAQATRTWVSGVGDDVNPCSRTAPCKTFAGAISKTAAGGEINCLDPGGYGTLTITKSITVDCTGTFGSSLNSGGINGFVINDSASVTPRTADVILRGLSINGAGTTPGLNGIRFISGRSLVVEDVFIQNQKSGSGISIQPGASNVIRVHIENVTVANSGRGILVQPTGNGTAVVTLDHFRAENNTIEGLRIDTVGNTGVGVRLSAEDSEFVGNATGVVVNTGTAQANAMLARSSMSGNSNAGVIGQGAVTLVLIGDSSITANATGVAFGGGATVGSYTTNRLNGNGADGAFSANFPSL